MTVEATILSQLLYNDEYARRVLPHLRSSYFEEAPDKALFKTYVEFWDKYNVAPTKDALALEIANRDDISDEVYDDAMGIIDNSLEYDKDANFDWLVDTTEEWCQDRAIHNGVMDAIAIIDGEDETRTRHAIPEILKEALSVSFTTNIGHDYLDDAESRYEYYHEDIARIPFDLTLFNKITNGGVPDGTLNVILAGTNVGKTMGMIHFTTDYLKQGKNVLYLTMEMAEQEIARRVDANLFDTAINKVEKMGSERFTSGINSIRKKTTGKLIIKQFPTGAAHVGHFRALLQELWLKKNFKPDVIVVDYIGICASSRVKMGNTNSYFYVKAIAEELRGLAIESECPLWTAVQATRGGYSNTDVEITDTAESFGLPATADFMFAFIRTDDFDKLGQILVKQLKNRYGNKSYYEKFLVGVDPERQKFFDLEDSAQSALTDYKEPTDDDDDDKPAPDDDPRESRRSKRGGHRANRKSRFKDYE